LVDHLERLPEPQRDALATAFGLRGGEAPDRFLVSLAVLSLFGDAAEERPLLCLVDDAQWLDRTSAQVLAFVARRLGAESVALVFGSRPPGQDDALTGLPELVVEGPRVRRREGIAGVRGGRPGWTIASATASSPRRPATRWRCSSCRAAATPRSSREASDCPTALP
jgi:hypothetical protein